MDRPMPCRYIIARYTGEPSRQEFINIGVIAQVSEIEFIGCRFLNSFARVKCIDPNADSNTLHSYARSWKRAVEQQQLLPSLEQIALCQNLDLQDPNLLTTISETANGRFTFSAPRVSIVTNAAAELESLYKAYVQPRMGRAATAAGVAFSSAQLRQKLVNAFISKGYIQPDRMQAEYQLPGTVYPWTFDLGFKNGCQEVIQSLALDDPKPETKLYRALIVRGMIQDAREAAMGDDVEAYVLVKPPLATEGRAGYEESIDLLQNSRIHVRPVNELSALVGDIADKLPLAA